MFSIDMSVFKHDETILVDNDGFIYFINMLALIKQQMNDDWLQREHE